LEASGAWPLSSLRQAFLNGTLTRLLDPDKILRTKIAEFVGHGDFGLASGQKSGGTFERVWYEEPVAYDEIAFEADVFLLKKARARELKHVEPTAAPSPGLAPVPVPTPGSGPTPGPGPEPAPVGTRTLRIVGTLRPELWNRLGTRILPKLRPGSELRLGVDFSVTVEGSQASQLEADLRQIVDELGLGESLRIE
jgi:hypothetical protein